MWWCSDTILFMDTEIWISHNFYMAWNISLLIFVTINKHTSHSQLVGCIKPGWIWPTGCSAWISVLHYLSKFPVGFHSGILLENSPFIAFLIFPVLLPGSPNRILRNHLSNKLFALGYLSPGLLLGETQLRQPAWLIISLNSAFIALAPWRPSERLLPMSRFNKSLLSFHFQTDSIKNA